ncbi:MAG: sel1 repeat family protein [Taibaiella sp.]|nr:sel1 repeat family protein [Taibaiella sp.]
MALKIIHLSKYFLGIFMVLCTLQLNAQSKFSLAKKALEEENYSAAFPLLKEASEIEKNEEAANLIGYLYYTGQGVQQDKSKAHEIWNALAAKGNVQAMLNLGDVALDSKAFELVETAIKWYKKAAEKGDVYSMITLGEIFTGTTQGYPANYPEAYKYFKMASVKGAEMGAISVSELYFAGVIPNKPTKEETLTLLKAMLKDLNYWIKAKNWGEIIEVNECNIKLNVFSFETDSTDARDYEITLPTDVQSISKDGFFQYNGNKVETKNVKINNIATEKDLGKITLWNTTDLVKLDPTKADLKMAFDVLRYLNTLCKKQ